MQRYNFSVQYKMAYDYIQWAYKQADIEMDFHKKLLLFMAYKKWVFTS